MRAWLQDKHNEAKLNLGTVDIDHIVIGDSTEDRFNPDVALFRNFNL